MSRLIDADKVAEAIAWLDEYDFVIWHDVQECIDKVPTVDAELVVKCNDCIYQTECAFNEWLGRNGNGFCSCGEGREDANN